MSKQNKKEELINHKSRIDLYKRSTYRKRNSKPENGLATTLRVVKYLYNEKKWLSIVISLIFISIIVSLSGEQVKRVLIDDFIKKGLSDGFSFYILILALLFVFEIITTFLSSYLMIGITQRTLKRMRKNIFTKLQSLAISFFDRNRDGDLMIRITNDVDNISNTMTQTFISFISSMMTLILTISLMLWMSWKLTIVALITIPLIYFAAKNVSKASRKRFRRMRYENGALNGFVAEQINGAKVIQSFCQEDEIIKEFSTESRRVKKITISALTFASLMNPVIGFLNRLRYIIIITAGAILAINGDETVTIGTIAVFLTLANRFGAQINNLANMYTDIQNALSGAERIFDILDDQTLIQDAENGIVLDETKGHVVLDHVSFGYLEDTPVLKDVSIDAKPGMKIALVGHTGAGKTTIINLVTRFYDINEGEILIDGINIKKITQESLLNHVGIVLQDTNLFSDTIYNNIRFGKLDATDEEIIEACKLANCHEFIMELPNQYNTVLSRNGSNISYGQRQLLSIARTILKNSDILILDEATSSVDTITEMNIQKAIDNLTTDKTSFVIAHRLSTIRHSDLIIVMNHGKIIEQGTHDQLLEQHGIYYQLHNAKDDEELKEFNLVNG
ncbi:ABC transporter ATP-binding protein [Mycoplasmatota bacterium]|nr:ABC transporter ATP-binding protein [Mycoplasmatota bacterium]